MITRRLFYLNTHRLFAYVWRKGELLAEGTFEPDDEGFGRFEAYLTAHRRSHFSLLANVAEEGHVLETIPFLQGGDRQALIARKIGQNFFGTSLSTAISLGYERNKRKNEKLLLSALTNPGHFEPWLQRIVQVGVPLAGIFSVAQMGGTLVSKLGHGKGRCLLLTMQDHSIRESYLVDGQTLFSRMAPVTDSSIAGTASAFAVEAGKLHQYLIGQRQIGREEGLRVFIVAHPQAIPAIEKSCPDRGQLSFTLIDSHAAARQLGLRTLPNDSRSDQLFLHLLATAAPKQQFANSPLRHDYHLSLIRHSLIAGGLIALLGAGLFAGRELYRAHAMRQEAATLATSQGELDWRYREIAATFPKLGIDNETLRRITDRYAQQVKQQHQPDRAYLLVSQALDRSPAIALERLDWKIDGDGKSTVADIAGNKEITTVRGTIRLPGGASPRQILSTLDQFVSLLRETPGTSVNVLTQPIDIGSGRALRGGDNDSEDKTHREFALEIIRELTP